MFTGAVYSFLLYIRMNTNFTVSDDISIADTLPVEQSVQDVLNEANINCSTEKMKIFVQVLKFIPTIAKIPK